MKLLLAATAVAAALAKSTSADSCAVATLSKLLLDQYIDQCSDDSGYGFTTGVKPDATEVAGMCASDACHSLLADVAAMNLTECTLPIGDKIYLFADLIDYVSDQCDADTPAPTTATSEPTTATPASTTATPAPTTATASCTSAQLKYLLTSTYEKQCITDTGYAFTSPTSPTDANVAAMCASESCVNLFAYVASMVTTDCRIPVGGKILLLADLVDYVSDQCEADPPAPTTETPTTPAPTTTTPTTPSPSTVATCKTSVLSSLLTDQYMDQCGDDSGYSFTSGVQPSAEEVAGMCASSACANLLADVEALGLSECILPIGNKIYLFADLIDYVADQCSSSTPAPATETPTTTAPASEFPGTETPGTETPSTTAPSPSTLTPGTESPITSTPGTETPNTTSESPTITDTPTTETPEPTSPAHDAC
ncbi:hypothetical protein PHYPSEUDO_012339 [Phytophthora pseudosyringae]|uniref:Elicitin n=1 Tax=Phytophthora pseudosyringae TaxID=221518 RepID=A0A8T1V6W3_9STRA|nr:hypothetical protein PHYPSEUDO_012339 [Phytophthora pseudosyringae]